MRTSARVVVFFVAILSALVTRVVAQEVSPPEGKDAFTELYALWKLSQPNPELAIAIGEDLLAREREIENPLSLPRDLIKAEVWFGIGNAYQDHPKGNRADNLEKAIGAYQEALKFYDWEKWPDQWVDTKINLGAAYGDRIRGNRGDNVERAIAILMEAVTVAKCQFQASTCASAQTNIGIAYQKRTVGDRADNLEKAIEAYQSALDATEQATAPDEWARLQTYLGNVYLHRLRGDPSDNMDKAISAHKAAMAAPVHDIRVRWASWHYYGVALRQRARGGRDDTLGAIFAFEQAEEGMRYGAHFERMISARQLGAAFLDMGEWAKAASAYARARKDLLELFAEGLDSANANDLISEAGPLYAEAAFAAAKQGDNQAALELAAEGRARLMSVALKLNTLSGDNREELERLRREIRDVERSLDNAKGTELAQAFKRLERQRDELTELLRMAEAPDTYVRPKELWARLDESRRKLDEQGFTGSSYEIEELSSKLLEPEVKRTAIAQTRAILSKGGTLVMPIVTHVGGFLLIVRSGTGKNKPLQVTGADLSNLTTERIRSLLHGDGSRHGWLAAYSINYLQRPELDQRWPEWLAAVEALGPQLWTLIGARLHQALQAAGVKNGERVIWLPSAGLGILPLGIAQDPLNKRRLADSYEIVYAPSLHALESAQAHIAKMASPTLAAIVNPTEDLTGTEEEGKLVASYFAGNDSLVLERAAATPDTVLAALKGKTHWHFASHGTFSWEDARQSALLMHDQARLSVGRLLDADGLGRPRLVVLSACETGLYDIDRNPDEFIGLPGTFTALGAAGVLGTLWPVSDAATALLMAKFYELHMGSKLAPPAALRQAQSWLRQATNADLTAYAKLAAKNGRLENRHLFSIQRALSESELTRSRNATAVEWIAPSARSTNKRSPASDANRLARPYAHPYFWAGFIHTGL